MNNKIIIDRISCELDISLDLIQNKNHKDEDILLLNKSDLKPVVSLLKNDFPFLMDICGVDYPSRDKRFEVVYHFANPKEKNRLRLKVNLGENENIDSLTNLYKGADWFEREAYDMFGIKFTDHHNLKRILCHKDFIGHALRKDYPADKNQILSSPEKHSLADEQIDDDDVVINIGPAHPATHGTLRIMAILSGERIKKADLEIGYLHRCFEKMCETHTYDQVIPYSDRLNYCSAPINNNTWCRGVEKMLSIEAPPRAQVIRVILDEFSRIIDHLVCIGANAVDVGALTNFWLGFRAREKVYDIFEKLSGARLTVSLARIGGLGFDLPKGWVEEAKEVLKYIKRAHFEIDKLCTKNHIFVNRMVDSCIISKEDAISWGFTGPCLRATGEPRDIRVDSPYSMYEEFDFDIPIAENGDSYDRYLVRMEEILQSCKIIEQALENIPQGDIIVNDPMVALPGKNDVYGNIEGLMNHFMLVIKGIRPKKSEVYVYGEGANGELGFYIVSDGSDRPYRVKCRPPCFAIFQAFSSMIEGGLIADAIAGLGSINIIAGELDR